VPVLVMISPTALTVEVGRIPRVKAMSNAADNVIRKMDLFMEACL
jgi:hypothetical protein